MICFGSVQADSPETNKHRTEGRTVYLLDMNWATIDEKTNG